jgi:hypothetical protein
MAESASATIAATQLASGDYEYTITLDDTGYTTIGTFWFAWIPFPFEDFLASSPSSEAAPAGWTDTITHAGSHDGYMAYYGPHPPRPRIFSREIH